MDNRRMQGGGLLPPPEKEVKPWKQGLSKEGHMLRLPTRMQIKPSKYKPKASKGPRNQPHCLNTSAKNEAIIKCRSCMWQGTCK
jgi:hypothetical protein